ncbi:hypothetical protein I545_1647 [Mycobacterium kansasii 662]|uniref:Uncharacterized protein n=2 Tax=Mycobacterium kansasii TaxID=1768 RepID=A0A1V3XDC6_MYCKA|nr:hypothetical protein I547_7390 [Mycobacterium kansasii 824]EUA21936.1 hypothetical protein I545_1647 [Mycobacterium kansasii 662]OOK77234.1 hypothetical protein BZL29_3102 [Mycobacterium kansasii]
MHCGMRLNWSLAQGKRFPSPPDYGGAVGCRGGYSTAD